MRRQFNGGYEVWQVRVMRFAAVATVWAVLGALPPSARGNATVGAWEPVQTLPWRPVHSSLLPTGKVMIWPSSDDPRLWDPASGSVTLLPNAGYNIFCAGHSFLADGKLLVTGGHISPEHGLRNASYYDPVDDKWTPLPDMNAGRWYPTNVTLANGNVVVMSGSKENSSINLIPQVWQVKSTSWRTLSSASLSLPLYPVAFLAPNGKVFLAEDPSRYLDTAGTGAWTTVAKRKVSGRNYGSAAMYDNGKVIYTGGTAQPTTSCEVIDLNATTPAWNLVAPMPQARRQHNATILPTGELLVTGGSSSSGFNTNDGPKPAISWNPTTNTWTTWAAESRYRGYHSEAVLLPNGRVASIGGNGESSLQVFSPPYLFKGGTRPAITSAPASVVYGQTFFVGTRAADITNVNWIRLTSVTHTKNMNQRINKLGFTRTANGLNVTAPSNPNLCPPGHYLLFILESNGVPSVARVIQIG